MLHCSLLIFVSLLVSSSFAQLPTVDRSGQKLGDQDPPSGAAKMPKISKKQLEEMKRLMNSLSGQAGDSETAKKSQKLLNSVNLNQEPGESQVQQLMELLQDSQKALGERDKALKDLMGE